MGQTLTHGVYLPSEGERNCYNGLAANWQLLDGAVGTIAEHTTQIAGKAPLVHTHTKADVTDLLNSNFVPSSNGSYNLGSLANRWGTVYGIESNVRSDKIDFTDTTTTGTKAHWHLSSTEKNGSTFFQIGSQRNHSAGLNEEHFRIKNVNDKWADLYIQLDDSNQFSIGTTTHSDVTNNGFKGKFTPLGSFIPNANNSYDLGSSSYQWNNLYAKNYYYNGVAWGLDKANVWAENNRFYKNAPLSSISSLNDPTLGFSANSNTIFFNTRGSGNYPSRGTFLFAGYSTGTKPDRLGQFKLVRSTDKKGETNDGYTPDSSFNLWRVAPDYLLMDIMEAVRVTNDGTENSLKPITNNATDLGTSTNKWTTLNGVNPGALSLPDYTLAKMDLIDFSQWSVAGQPNEYTPISDGWLFVNIKDTASNSIFIYAYGLYNADLTKATDYSMSCFGNGSQGVKGRIAVMIPVRAGIAYRVFIRAASVSEIYSAKFYPALGNV